MPHLLARATAVIPVLLASLAAPLAGPATAAAGSPHPAQAATTPLVLLTGGRVLASPAGPGPDAVTVLPAPGRSTLASSLVTMRFGTRSYLIPAAALPYLGRGLDPSLFDLTALRQAEAGGRLPVTLHYRGRAPALPGVTITRTGPGTAAGYLTSRSAERFGSALARQMLSDHGRGSYGTDGLFANGLSISLPGARPAPPRPAFPMHTLTATGTNLAGKPDTGDTVTVLNVTNLAKFGDPVESENFFYHGTAKFSLPSGTYWAYASYLTGTGFRVDVLPQFTVRGNRSIRLSERAASSEVTAATPRPAVAQMLVFTLLRGGITNGWLIFGKGSFWVSPTSRKPTAGTLQTYTAEDLTSPPGGRVPYAYSLNFPGPPGIIPAQHFVVHPAALATVSGRYYQDVGSTGAWGTFGGTPKQLRTQGLFVTAALPLHLPGRLVQYLSASPPSIWQSSYSEFSRNDPGQTNGGQTDAFRLLHGGQHLTVDWNRFPLHPGPNVVLTNSGMFPTLPSAARAGNKLTLDITPFTDNTFGHLGSGFFHIPAKIEHITGSYALYQNGTRIAHGNAVKAASFNGDLLLHAKLSPKPSLIKFALTASRAGKSYLLSAASRDVWTWPSRPEPKATVPAGWYCNYFIAHHALHFNRHCAVQRMVTLRYRVSGLGLHGTTAPGRQSVAITTVPLQLTTPSPVTTAGVQVSVNGGKTWQRTGVHRTGPASFRTGFTAPAGHRVSLRVTVRTKAGATLTETILGAYQTAS
jgi:hypothetical protein